MMDKIKRTLSKWANRNQWKDDDEYQRARWAYQGQGVGATKAAWMLGAGFLAVTAYSGFIVYDRHELATLGDLKFVVMETNRTTGEIVTVSITDGKLALDETKRRQFIRYWIGLWRSVGTDPVEYNTDYITAQVYMSDDVYTRIDAHLNNYPVKQFIEGQMARVVRNVKVTPTGNGLRYRVDWTEVVYRQGHPQPVSETQQTADLDLEQFTPKTDEEAEANMFGFMIKGFYWSPPPGVA